MNKKEEIKIPKIDKNHVKSMIYTIRGQKVILDFDLAKLFGYETKVFNQHVKRNHEKFQNGCVFRLTNDELLVARSQNVTAQIWATNNGGRTTLPYAFTEQGIKTLSTVLRGPNVTDITSLLLETINNNQVLNTEKWLNEANNYEIVKYENGDIILDVNVSPDEDTVWLTTEQMAILFDRDRSVISKHIINIYNEEELEKNTSVHFLHISDNNPQNRPPELYNLDVVISVGYRVKSKRGIIFRRWATSILKQYLIKGYSINTKRCLEHSDIIMSLTNDINELKETTKDIKEIKEKLDTVTNYFNDPKTHKHYALFKGNRIESDIAYQTIYKLANESIIIIDDYIDIKTLQLLKCIESNINITIITDNNGNNELNKNYITDFIKDTGFKIAIKENNRTFHSRYIIIDYMTNNYQIYLCGGSSKDGGTRINTIIEIEEKEVYKSIIDKALNHKELKIK